MIRRKYPRSGRLKKGYTSALSTRLLLPGVWIPMLGSTCVVRLAQVRVKAQQKGVSQQVLAPAKQLYLRQLTQSVQTKAVAAVRNSVGRAHPGRTSQTMPSRISRSSSSRLVGT